MYRLSHFAGIILFFFVGLMSHLAWCEEKQSLSRITIEADRMESLQKENAVSFIGNVEAKQGDIFLNADKMTIYYFSGATDKEDLDGFSKNIEKLYAQGNVTLSKNELTASGDRVDYFTQEQKVIITGNTKVLRDNNVITGEKIVLYLNEGKSVVESDSENGNRVKAIINPGSQNNE